jgi:hypothetical protein
LWKLIQQLVGPLADRQFRFQLGDAPPGGE